MKPHSLTALEARRSKLAELSSLGTPGKSPLPPPHFRWQLWHSFLGLWPHYSPASAFTLPSPHSSAIALCLSLTRTLVSNSWDVIALGSTSIIQSDPLISKALIQLYYIFKDLFPNNNKRKDLQIPGLRTCHLWVVMIQPTKICKTLFFLSL